MDNNSFKKYILKRINEINNPKRVSLSLRYPKLMPYFIRCKRVIRQFNNKLDFSLSFSNNQINNGLTAPYIIFRHQSPLYRKFCTADNSLINGKINNLELAIKKINGMVIYPNKVFSFWTSLGYPSRKKGYSDGMLLASGKVTKGIGGGLCQLSNLLYWMFLHTPMKITERSHHAFDVFPDTSRTLPFGSGATIFYNYVDLKVLNNTPNPVKIKLFLNDKYLKGQLLSNKRLKYKYHIIEKNHLMIKKANRYYRYNQIYRQIINSGKLIKEELITENLAPVMYKIDKNYLLKNNFQLMDFNNQN